MVPFRHMKCCFVVECHFVVDCYVVVGYHFIANSYSLYINFHLPDYLTDANEREESVSLPSVKSNYSGLRFLRYARIVLSMRVAIVRSAQSEKEALRRKANLPYIRYL